LKSYSLLVLAVLYCFQFVVILLAGFEAAVLTGELRGFVQPVGALWVSSVVSNGLLFAWVAKGGRLGNLRLREATVLRCVVSLTFSAGLSLVSLLAALFVRPLAARTAELYQNPPVMAYSPFSIVSTTLLENCMSGCDDGKFEEPTPGPGSITTIGWEAFAG
jgi:hypothetical protein